MRDRGANAVESNHAGATAFKQGKIKRMRYVLDGRKNWFIERRLKDSRLRRSDLTLSCCNWESVGSTQGRMRGLPLAISGTVTN